MQTRNRAEGGREDPEWTKRERFELGKERMVVTGRNEEEKKDTVYSEIHDKKTYEKLKWTKV